MTNPIIIVISPENKTLEEIRGRFPLFDVRPALGADDISALTAVASQVAAVVIHLKTQDEWVNFDFLRTCFAGTPIFAILNAANAEEDEYNALKRATEYGAELTYSEPVNFDTLAQAIRKASTKSAVLPNYQSEVRGLSTEHLELSIKINQQISRLHQETSKVMYTVSESFRNPDAGSIGELRDILRHIETVSFESY
jgi:DNA-binding NarL/FixJ family response regulator